MRRRLTGPLSRRFFDRPGGQPVPPQLLEANRFFEMGDYQGAAERFEQLANMQAAGRPRIAARLLIEAGRSRLMAGQEPSAMDLFRRGLGMLSGQQRWLALHRMGLRVVQALRERGFIHQADEIADWLSRQPAAPGAENAPTPAARPQARLPLRCPSCGGPIDPREVEWVDESSAECVYCGSIVRAGEG